MWQIRICLRLQRNRERSKSKSIYNAKRKCKSNRRKAELKVAPNFRLKRSSFTRKNLDLKFQKFEKNKISESTRGIYEERG